MLKRKIKAQIKVIAKQAKIEKCQFLNLEMVIKRLQYKHETKRVKLQHHKVNLHLLTLQKQRPSRGLEIMQNLYLSKLGNPVHKIQVLYIILQKVDRSWIAHQSKLLMDKTIILNKQEPLTILITHISMIHLKSFRFQNSVKLKRNCCLKVKKLRNINEH